MLDSPAKRRKSNSSSAIAVSASNTAQQSQVNGVDVQKPQRPSRASFQSPTRASLARSHPDVLSRVLSRSPAKTAQQRPASRGRESVSIGGGGGVGDGQSGVRGSRLPRPSSLSVTSALVKELPIRQAIQKFVPLSPRRGSSVPVSASQPPRKSSQRSQVSLSAEPGAQRPTPQPPLRGKDPTFGPIVDESIANGRRTRSSSSPGQGHGEPELPPTPTELGLERVPSRRRGLLSSSSPSYRLEKKRKQRIRDGVKRLSPLKAKGPEVDTDNVADQVASPRITFPEDDVPDPVGEKVKLRDALAAQLARLKEEVAKIEYEAQRYEKPDEYPAPDEESINNLIELLTTSNPSCAPPPPPPPSPPPVSSVLSFLLPFSSSRFIPSTEPAPPPSTSPPPENPFALHQPADLTPYLTLFAPLSLTAYTTTTTSTSILPNSTQEPSSSSSPIITQTHNLTLSAPAPFPTHLFQIPISLQTNPESQSVVSISIPAQPQPHHPDKPVDHNIPPTLSSWLQTRLSNPLLQRDISGLCWGISRYWEADISRAKIWAELEELRDRVITTTLSSAQKVPSVPNRDDDNDKENDKKTYTPHILLPHLGRTSFLFSVVETRQRKPEVPAGGSVHSAYPQLLVTCPLRLDLWTSEPQLQPDISVSVPLSSPAGSPEKMEREAKRVFRSFLGSAHGKGKGKGKGWKAGAYGQVEIDGDAEVLVRAVEGVVGVLFGVV
ncbi:hypothetical protein BDDG_07861 [Blastomyces dermatitidis ATCC 18188]|uniref:Uncharacterized protein n=1 Tax=Ajellomyces dermatitidis (strain ATCC 18188 / CBS 674.68) TaxID=653446 RepID=F2TNV3_AJEDA|nr:hypothetical protein BDDG_07861 [Blastomyces dermatitidis ATCC 18188]